jgi:hypothetical protein
VPPFDVDLKTMIRSVKEQGFEGVIAKRIDSCYEPGLRSGLWQKMRVNQGQEFVVGGYSTGNPFDALIFGYYEDGKLLYAGRTRAGFTPVVRASVFKKFKGLEIVECPFVNLLQKKAGRWGAGLTKEKMKDCDSTIWTAFDRAAQASGVDCTRHREPGWSRQHRAGSRRVQRCRPSDPVPGRRDAIRSGAASSSGPASSHAPAAYAAYPCSPRDSLGSR